MHPSTRSCTPRRTGRRERRPPSQRRPLLQSRIDTSLIGMGICDVHRSVRRPAQAREKRGEGMKRRMVLFVAAAVLLSLLAVSGGSAADGDGNKAEQAMSGTAELRDIELGHFLTECPQAGRGLDPKPKPLDRRAKDAVEKKSEGGDDRRANQDYSCFPQDENSISINPTNGRNIVAGANDYRLGTGSSGFYATTDGGNSWYDGIIPFPSAPAASTTRRSASSVGTTRTVSSSSARRTVGSRGAAPASAARTRPDPRRARTRIRASPATGSSRSTRTTTCS